MNLKAKYTFLFWTFLSQASYHPQALSQKWSNPVEPFSLFSTLKRFQIELSLNGTLGGLTLSLLGPKYHSQGKTLEANGTVFCDMVLHIYI